MTKAISRCVRMDNWIFEIKMVRALKVDSYGKPYEAIAQLNINGDFGYLDGALHAHQDSFSQEDIETFIKISKALSLQSLKFGEQSIALDTEKSEDKTCSAEPSSSRNVKKIA